VVKLARLALCRHSVAQTMAQTAQQTVSVDPDLARVRAAFVQYAEVVAAYAGYGVEVDQPDAERRADCNFLVEVTNMVLQHRAKQRVRQRNAAYNCLGSALAEDYAKLRDGKIADDGELRSNIVAMCGELGFSPTPEELNVLAMPVESDVVEADGRPLSIKEAGGPMEAAKLALAKVVGRSVGTLVTAGRRANVLLIGRRAFGRWVPPRMVIAFLDGLILESTAPKREVPPLPMRALYDVDDTSGEALDRFVEILTAQFATPQRLRVAFNSPTRGPYGERFRRQLTDVHAERERAVLEVISLLEIFPTFAEARLANLQRIGDIVRPAAGKLLRAIIAGDAQVATSAGSELSDAIWTELFETGSAWFARNLADVSRGTILPAR
jgi:hypothetical protein